MNMKTVFGIKPSLKATAEKPKSYRSTSYEKQFEGYTQRMEVTASGKKRLVRSYTGDYYMADLPRRKYVLMKLCNVGLYMGAAAGFMLYGRCGYLRRWEAVQTVLEMLTLFALLWLGLKLLFYLTAPRKMTVGEYKGSCLALKNTAKWAAAGSFTTAMALLLSECLALAPISGWIFPLLLILASGCCALGIHLCENRRKYLRIPSEDSP